MIICLDQKLQENEQGLCTFKNMAWTRNVREGLQNRQKNRVQPFLGNALKSGKNSHDSTFMRPFALHQVVALPQRERGCTAITYNANRLVTWIVSFYRKMSLLMLQLDFLPKKKIFFFGYKWTFHLKGSTCNQIKIKKRMTNV